MVKILLKGLFLTLLNGYVFLLDGRASAQNLWRRALEANLAGNAKDKPPRHASLALTGSVNALLEV
jgi:hypothetical protein